MIPPCRRIFSPRRRRVAFRIAPDGVPEVLAPAGIAPETLREIVARHRTVIEELYERAVRMRPPEIEEGAGFFFRGALYPVRDTHRLLAFDRAFLLPEGDPAERRASLENLYRKAARDFLLPRAAALAEKVGVGVKKWKISGAATRYGSCSARGVCSLSWRLMQFPDELIDYVIFHELAHRLEMNHSERFYAVLEKFVPGAGLLKKKLHLFAATNKLL